MKQRYRSLWLPTDETKEPNGWLATRWETFNRDVESGDWYRLGIVDTDFGNVYLIEKKVKDHWRVLAYGPDRKITMEFPYLSTREFREQKMADRAREEYAASSRIEARLA